MHAATAYRRIEIAVHVDGVMSGGRNWRPCSTFAIVYVEKVVK
jgi:hypothetical protein